MYTYRHAYIHVYMCVFYICIYTYIYIYIYVDTPSYVYMYIDITNLNALYTQRSNMLLNNDIQVQRPNTLHNKIQPTYFPFLLITNYLVEAKCMPGDTHPVLSQKHSQDFRIVACLDESPSRFVHVVLGWWVRRLAPFLRCLVETSTKKKKAHSQSNKPTSTVGSLKPPSSFDRTIDLYSAALSAEGYWIGFSERFITACLWKGWLVPTDSISASRSSGQSKCMAFTPWLEVEVVVFEVLIQDNRADCIASFLPKGDHIEYPCRPPQDRFGVLVADRTA